MPKIKFSLNPDSIGKALAELEAYQKKVEDLGPGIVKAATELGVEEAKNQALFMNAYDTGELVNSIVGEVRDEKGHIMSTAPHGKFVEFGTGIRGKQSPYPVNPPIGWQYDVNEHGEAGWWYIGDDGKQHWTKGMPSRPFMYDTAQSLRQSLPWIAEGLLNGEEES